MAYSKIERAGVVGAGSWGTALAQVLAAKGIPVSLWAREPEVARSINAEHQNPCFLRGIPLSENIVAHTELAPVCEGKDLVVMVVPSEWFRQTGQAAAPHIPEGAALVSATKGIEVGTRLTMAGILREVVPHVPEGNVCALSGPSFAREVAMGLPTVVTVATKDQEVAKAVQQAFAAPTFRVYTNDDLLGVELGGAVKNVMAIASGITDGLCLGANTRAALITRGLAEIRRLGVALGAKPRTFTGLAGVGDLVLTCTTDQSRNYSVGFKIGRGQKLAEILSEMKMVAEGVRNARSVYNLAQSAGVEMPIVTETYRVLYEDLDPREALFNLMTRRLRPELDEV
ncbi:MAG: NAD(P)H-dependent glycerol-3-phosphate dehydrogenase [Thermodesulfobacteriota bacterium]